MIPEVLVDWISNNRMDSITTNEIKRFNLIICLDFCHQFRPSLFYPNRKYFQKAWNLSINSEGFKWSKFDTHLKTLKMYFFFNCHLKMAWFPLFYAVRFVKKNWDLLTYLDSMIWSNHLPRFWIFHTRPTETYRQQK